MAATAADIALALENDAVVAYNYILAYYGVPELSSEKSATLFQNTVTPDYGELYAGAYYDRDSGQLVVLMVPGSAEKSMEEKGSLLRAVPKSNIVFKAAKYSYRYLEALVSELNAIWEEHVKAPKDQNSVWEDVSSCGGDGGDSGGIVFSSSYVPAGILVAGIPNTMYYCTAYDIATYLKCFPY